MTARQPIHVDDTPQTVPVLALKASGCAASLGVSLGTFLALVAEGKMPKPIPIPGHKGLALYDWESVKNAWKVLVEAAGAGEGNPFD